MIAYSLSVMHTPGPPACGGKQVARGAESRKRYGLDQLKSHHSDLPLRDYSLEHKMGHKWMT